jgi:hypothetical protein
METRRNKNATALLVAVIACAPLIVRCSSVSGLFDTSGGGGTGGDQAVAGSGATGVSYGGSSSPSAGNSGGPSGGAGGSTPTGDAGAAEMGGAEAAGAGDPAESGDSAGSAGSGGSHSGGMGGGAGSSGSSGAAGSGGTARSGGLGGSSGLAGSAGAGGVSGSAGNGGIGGSGGAGGGGSSPGQLTLSATELDFAVMCPEPPVADPQMFTVDNAGGTALTWSASFDATKVAVSPSGSTLAPGVHVDVTVSPAPIVTSSPVGTMVELGDIHITNDVPGASAQTVTLLESALGYFVNVPPDMDFGDVFVDSSVLQTVPVMASVPGAILGSSNPDFYLNGAAPDQNARWTATFAPTKAGLQTTTLTLGSFLNCIWPPNTFKATGTGVLDSSCSSAGDTAPCATDGWCMSGVCTFHASFSYVPELDAQAAIEFEGTVAYLINYENVPLDVLTATVDWGDGQITPGVISDIAGSLAISGSHTYAHAGDFAGRITLLDGAEGLSVGSGLAIVVTE